MDDKKALTFMGGILTIQAVGKTIKNILKHPRPIKSGTYGMPSNRAAVMTFIALFLISNFKLSENTKFIILTISGLSILMKLLLKEHSAIQLFWGIVLGAIISRIMVYSIKKY